MAVTPYTRAEALAAGFVALANTQSLLLHTRYPGFLFKIVETLDQAIAAGGALFRGTNEQVLYLGLDLTRTAKMGKFGAYGRPTGFTLARNALSPISHVYLSGQGFSSSVAGARFDMTMSGWTDVPGDGKYLAIISRADRGLIVDRAWKAAIPDELITVGITLGGIPVHTGARDAGWVTYQPSQYIALRLPLISGFMSNVIPVKKKAFLAAARAGFIGSIEADSRIVAAYRTAYDAHMATLADSDLALDAMTVYPHVASVGATVQFTSTRRELKRYRLGNLDLSDAAAEAVASPSSSMLMVFKYDTVSQIQNADGSYRWPPSVSFDAAIARNITSIASLPHEQTVAGIPFPFWMVSGIGQTQNADRESFDFSPVDSQTRRLSQTGELFTLDAVPYTHVKMVGDVKLAASSLYSGFGPRVRPDSLDPEERLLDISERVNLEVAAVTGIPHLPAAIVGGTNDTEREAAAIGLNAEMAAREAAILAACKHLTPFTAFITESVAAITSRARQTLKG